MSSSTIIRQKSQSHRNSNSSFQLVDSVSEGRNWLKQVVSFTGLFLWIISSSTEFAGVEAIKSRKLSSSSSLRSSSQLNSSIPSHLRQTIVRMRNGGQKQNEKLVFKSHNNAESSSLRHAVRSPSNKASSTDRNRRLRNRIRVKGSRSPLNPFSSSSTSTSSRINRMSSTNRKNKFSKPSKSTNIKYDEEPQYRLKVLKTHLSTCPGTEKYDEIVRNSRLELSQKSNGGRRVDNLTINEDDGSVAESIFFPGCFDVRLHMSFNKAISNPYVTSTVSIGGEYPCDRFNNNPYCTESQHPEIDNMYGSDADQGNGTCRFCDLCVGANELKEELKRKGASFGMDERTKQSCHRRGEALQPNRAYHLVLQDICSPSQKEIEQTLTRKFGKNWRDFKRYALKGEMYVKVQVLDRLGGAPRPCLELGAGIFKWHGPKNNSLHKQMKRRLQDRCAPFQAHRRSQLQRTLKLPQDRYVGCYMATINYQLDELS